MGKLQDLQQMRQQKRLSDRLNSLVPYLIVLLVVGLVFLTTRLAATTQEVKETSAYTRTTNCIIAKSAKGEFTQEEIERCYIQVEKATGVSLERFDEQTNGEN